MRGREGGSEGVGVAGHSMGGGLVGSTKERGGRGSGGSTKGSGRGSEGSATGKGGGPDTP